MFACSASASTRSDWVKSVSIDSIAPTTRCMVLPEVAICRIDDDQIVPIAASAYRAAEIVKNAQLKVYPGGSYGLAQTQAEQFNKSGARPKKDLQPLSAGRGQDK